MALDAGGLYDNVLNDVQQRIAALSDGGGNTAARIFINGHSRGAALVSVNIYIKREWRSIFWCRFESQRTGRPKTGLTSKHGGPSMHAGNEGVAELQTPTQNSIK